MIWCGNSQKNCLEVENFFFKKLVNHVRCNFRSCNSSRFRKNSPSICLLRRCLGQKKNWKKKFEIKSYKTIVQAFDDPRSSNFYSFHKWLGSNAQKVGHRIFLHLFTRPQHPTALEMHQCHQQSPDFDHCTEIECRL